MGIPSYYKKLLHTVPGLVSAHRHQVDWLFMDFNCLIYYCIPHVEYGSDFETALIEAVIKHLRMIVKEVAATKGVYIAIDGVVPMAKMRQQRLRRFKSVWEKMRVCNKEKSQSWDTNAITPGTVFMGKLGAALQTVCDAHGWILSDSNQPGEGEHKLMSQWRTGRYRGDSIAVYGMDADLIVLSLLGQAQNELGAIWLFREQELGLEWFSIDLLKRWILQNRDPSFIMTYCFAMSVLGNDFLPSSLGLKMRDGGHDELLRCLTMPLLDADGIIEKNLFELFSALAITEPHRIRAYVHGKQRHARFSQEKELGENNWPLSQIEYWLLDPNWQQLYWKGADPVEVCQEYLKGIKWIWSYYTTGDVCYNWFYPYSLPPLWSSLVQMGRDSAESYKIVRLHTPPLVQAEAIKPVEQLCLVLPLASWSLIPDSPQKKFPMLAPQFFPSSFVFEAVGKRFFWECEPLIPIPTIVELKALVSTLKGNP